MSMSVFQRNLDLAPTATIDKVALNNTVVAMRAVVKRARLFVINDLVKKIHKLRKRKGSEVVQNKHKSKADRMLEEIQILKNLKPDYISKYALGSTEKFEDIVMKASADIEMRAVARLAQQKFIQERVTRFRSEHSDWKELAAYLMTKHTSREFKKKKTKEKKEKLETNVKLSETLVKKYLNEKLEGQEIESDDEGKDDEIASKKKKQVQRVQAKCTQQAEEDDSDIRESEEIDESDASGSGESSDNDDNSIDTDEDEEGNDRIVQNIKSSQQTKLKTNEKKKPGKVKLEEMVDKNEAKPKAIKKEVKQTLSTKEIPRKQCSTDSRTRIQNKEEGDSDETDSSDNYNDNFPDIKNKNIDYSDSSSDAVSDSDIDEDYLIGKGDKDLNEDTGSDSGDDFIANESGNIVGDTNDDEEDNESIDDDDEEDDDDDDDDDGSDDNDGNDDSDEEGEDENDNHDDISKEHTSGDTSTKGLFSKDKSSLKTGKHSNLLNVDLFTGDAEPVEPANDTKVTKNTKKSLLTEKVDGEMIVRRLDLKKDFEKDEVPTILLNQSTESTNKHKKKVKDIFFAAESDEDDSDSNEINKNRTTDKPGESVVDSDKKSSGSFERSIEPTMSSFSTTFLGSLNSDEMMACTDSKYRSNEEWKRIRHERKEQQVFARGRGRGRPFQQGFDRSGGGRGAFSNRGRGGFKGGQRGRQSDRGWGAGRGSQSRSYQQSNPKSFSGPDRGRGGKQSSGHQPASVQKQGGSKPEGLHPSWEASRKRKQEQKNVLQVFTGKKVKFDE